MNQRPEPASRDQVNALFGLYARSRARAPKDLRDPRGARLRWASESVGREVASFADLTADEVRELIHGLKASLARPVEGRPDRWRPIRSRERAHAAGTSGRADEDQRFVQLANADDLARIHDAVRRLGWSRERFAAWLASRSSPLPSKRIEEIRTVAEVNRVWWALKAMLQRSGKWASSARQQESGHLGRSASEPTHAGRSALNQGVL
jgi:hypothetical protein